jgi:flagellar protein FlaI
MPRLRIPRIKRIEHEGKVSIIALIRKLIKGYKILEKQKRESIRAAMERGGATYPPYPYRIKGELIGKLKRPQVKKPEGIEIPTGRWSRGAMPAAGTGELEEELRAIDIYYPLIPYSPKRGEKIFAYARIKWDPKEGAVVYNVIEPKLSLEDKETIEKIKKMLEERLDISFTKLGKINAKELLKRELEDIVSVMSGIPEDKKEILAYYIERDTIGLGPIEPFMNDMEIEDISCDGEGIPMYVYHRDPRFGSLKTNVIIETKDELNAFVMRLAQKCEKMISIAEPLLDASLPGGSRLQATLGTDIARRGSNFTIRRFTEKPLTPTHMLKFKTLNSTQLAFLWLAIENGKSMLVSGGTATGKTSLLNALSLFIKPSFKIVSIEDTPELRLPHPHWVPHVARTPISIRGEIGEVSLFDLLKSSLRQRPDYLVVGEVRGKEAYVMFQQIATGHPSLATIHAASIPQLVDRLITPPISLPPTLLENIDIIVFLVLTKRKGKYVRRANEILEVWGVEKDKLMTTAIFKWMAVSDKFEPSGKSKILENIAKRQGLTEETIKDELMRRKSILEWMKEREIYNYEEVSRIISTYYSNPKRIMDLIGA